MPKPTYQSELSLKNKVGRFAWDVLAKTLFKLGLRNSHQWRIFWLRCFGARIGTNCKVYPGVRIWAPWNLVMEDRSCLGDRVDCYAVATITLKSDCIVSQDASLCAATHDYESPAFTLIPKPIVIGSEAWVCARAFVGPGVVVGDRSVIGACSVLTKDADPDTVYAGNPAKPIKKREIRGAE